MKISKRLKALVTDDFSSYRDMIKRILEKFNYQVIEATDGQEAVEFFLNEEFDLLTMDYQMPNLNGADAVLKIRKKNKDVPVVCISSSLSVMRPQLKHLKNIYFLDKPIDTQLLEEIITQIRNDGNYF